MRSENAETGQLAYYLHQIGEGLDQYLKFEHPDALSSSYDWHAELDTPLPQAGEGIEAVVQSLIEHVIPHGSPVPNPGFSAFITTGAVTTAALATTAASIASPQRYMLHAFNYLEELSLEWLAQMCGIPQLKGVYSSGGSVANLVALGGARQQAFERVNLDPAANGVNQPVRIYASDQCHHTIQRAAGVLGVGRHSVQAIACDERGRMRVDKLRQALEQDRQRGILSMAIVANAGTTNTGAIDPLLEMGQIARQYGIWFHIDGAYGLPGVLDARLAQQYQGLELADSVIVDPHKWLGASVGIAATFVRDRSILERAFTQEHADYLEGSAIDSDNAIAHAEHSLDDFGIRYFDFGVELSAPCRGVAVWAMLKEIGVEGMRLRICRHNDMATELARLCHQHPNLEVLLEPTLSICCFRYRSDRVADLDGLNQQLHRQLVRENQYMPSTTRIGTKLALRPCFVGARAEMGQVQELVDAVLRIGGELVQTQSHLNENS